MGHKFSIYDATPEDADMLAHVIRESFRDVAKRFLLTPQNCPKHPSNCTSEWIQSDQARGIRYFVLSQEGELIGCVGLEASKNALFYLERLAVLPEWRRKGFGRALVGHALSVAKASGARRIGIGIIADHVELKQWYAKFGFVEVEKKSFPHLPFKVCFMELNIDTTK